MMVMIEHIAFVAYPCADVTRTRQWYEETLGLSFAGAYKEDGVEKYNEAHLGDASFALMWAEWLSRAPGSATSVAFEVSDFDDAIARVKKTGTSVFNVQDLPRCRQAHVSDPEGNVVLLHERKT